jgi:hypothetical protein
LERAKEQASTEKGGKVSFKSRERKGGERTLVFPPTFRIQTRHKTEEGVQDPVRSRPIDSVVVLAAVKPFGEVVHLRLKRRDLSSDRLVGERVTSGRLRRGREDAVGSSRIGRVGRVAGRVSGIGGGRPLTAVGGRRASERVGRLVLDSSHVFGGVGREIDEASVDALERRSSIRRRRVLAASWMPRQSVRRDRCSCQSTHNRPVARLTIPLPPSVGSRLVVFVDGDDAPSSRPAMRRRRQCRRR